MSFLKQIRELWDHLRGKGPAAAVALTLDLGEARDNKPYMFEGGGLVVESCTGDLYVRINGPNADGMNLCYIHRIVYPFNSIYLSNPAQAGKSARIVLLPTGMEADCPRVAAAAPCACLTSASATLGDLTTYAATFTARYGTFASNATLLSVEVTVDKRCILVCMATVWSAVTTRDCNIESPLGTNHTNQRYYRWEGTAALYLEVLEACFEVEAGTHTVYLVNRSGRDIDVYVAWLKARPVG